MGELRKIMQFRNMTFPLSACPLTISALSHLEVFGMCKKWLRQYILEHKSWCISFHLPSGSIRESAHSSFHQLLWNHKNFNLCVVAFKFAISFRVSPRLVAMFLLPQNKLQRRFQVTGGSPFVQQSNSSFSQSRAIFPKDRAAVHSLVKVTRAPPPLGFRIPCFCQFAVAIAPGTCRADSTPRRL
jgi:hypothetical protein